MNTDRHELSLGFLLCGDMASDNVCIIYKMADLSLYIEMFS